MAADHALDAQGQGDGHDRGQAFGDGRHGQADRGQEDVDDPPAPQETDAEDEPDQHEAGIDDPLSELFQPFLERRGLAGDGLDQAGDAPQLGGHAGLHDQCPSLPPDDGRSHVKHVGPVRQGHFGFVQGPLRFEHGGGFTGQRRFEHGEIGRMPDEAGVSRNAIAGFELDHVARDDLDRRNGGPRSAPNDPGERRSHPSQGLQGFFGPEFLEETENRVKDDDGDDGRGVHPFLEKARYKGRAYEDPDHEIGELPQEHAPGAGPLGLLDAVGTEAAETRAGLFRRQPGLAVGSQIPGGFAGFEMPPVFHMRLFGSPIAIGRLLYTEARLRGT